MICALALMGGQNHIAVGIEWLAVASVAAFIYIFGYIQAINKGESSVGLRFSRLVGGTACYVAEIVGAIVLISGHIAGLYVSSVALIIFFAFIISGAWLLLVGVYQDKSKQRE